jgi:hypothetical protein
VIRRALTHHAPNGRLRVAEHADTAMRFAVATQASARAQ